MRKKIGTTILGMVFSMCLLFTMSTTVMATEVDANVDLQKATNADNQVNVSFETSSSQSVASFQLSFTVETEVKEDIKGVNIGWSSEIQNDAELKEVTYNNNTINIYVVSKNELGENNETRKKIDIGTLTIETEDKDNIDVTIKATKASVKMASLNHQMTTVSNEIDTEVNLRINARNNSDNNLGDDNNQNNDDYQNGGNEQLGENNQGESGTQNGSSNQGTTSNGGNSQGGQNGSGIQYEEWEEYESQTEPQGDLDNQEVMKVDSPLEDIFNGKLPQTGPTFNKAIMIIAFIIVVALIIGVSKIKIKKKNIY